MDADQSPPNRSVFQTVIGTRTFASFEFALALDLTDVEIMPCGIVQQ